MSEINLDPAKSLILMYDNDLLDSIYIDLDNSYAVISAHTEGYDELADKLESIGASVLSVGNFNPEAEPHCYVIKSLGRLIVQTCEELIAD